MIEFSLVRKVYDESVGEVWNEKSNYIHNLIVHGMKLLKDENGMKIDSTYYKR